MPYPKDKRSGIIMMVVNLCYSAAASSILMVSGGQLWGIGAAAASRQGGSTGSEAATGTVGVLLVVFGVVTILLGLAGAAAGFGVMKGLRWGFNLSLVVAVLSLISNSIQLAGHNCISVAGIGICGAIAYYCCARLDGKMGSPPV